MVGTQLIWPWLLLDPVWRNMGSCSKIIDQLNGHFSSDMTTLCSLERVSDDMKISGEDGGANPALQNRDKDVVEFTPTSAFNCRGFIFLDVFQPMITGYK